MCKMHLFLFAFIFQSSTQEGDDKMTFKCSLLSSKARTDKDVHLQLSSLPPSLPPVHFCAHCY